MKYEVIEIRCIGCGELTTPGDIDWLLFRTAGLHVHNKAKCHDLAYRRLYGKLEGGDREK